MKKSLFGLIVLFVFLTTYTPKFSFNTNSVLNIQKIIIENNLIIESGKIKKKLIFLYDKNLFFLNNKTIQEKLKNESRLVKKDSISVLKEFERIDYED